jgi:hypothetical protein
VSQRIKQAFYHWLNSEGNLVSLLLLMALGVASFGTLLVFLTFQGPAFKPSPPKPMVANTDLFEFSSKPAATVSPQDGSTQLEGVVVPEAAKAEPATPQARTQARVQVKGTSTQPKLRELVGRPEPLAAKPQKSLAATKPQKSLAATKPQKSLVVQAPPASGVAKPEMPLVGKPAGYMPKSSKPDKAKLPKPVALRSSKASSPAAPSAKALSKPQTKPEQESVAKKASQPQAVQPLPKPNQSMPKPAQSMPKPAQASDKPSSSSNAPAVPQLGGLPVSVHTETAKTTNPSSEISFVSSEQAAPNILEVEPLIEESTPSLAEPTTPRSLVVLKPLEPCKEEPAEAASLGDRNCMLP